MKIPKYVDTAIENRVKAIAMYWRNDEIVRNWCEKNGIETDDGRVPTIMSECDSESCPVQKDETEAGL